MQELKIPTELVVATDHDGIFNEIKNLGQNVIMTDSSLKKWY